jgi:hypothetical protein
LKKEVAEREEKECSLERAMLPTSNIEKEKNSNNEHMLVVLWIRDQVLF